MALTQTTTQKGREADLAETLAHYRKQIGDMPVAIRKAASEHFETEVRFWETIYGRPLIEEKDFEVALVRAVLPDLEEICGGDTATSWETVSVRLYVLALELRALKAQQGEELEGEPTGPQGVG